MMSATREQGASICWSWALKGVYKRVIEHCLEQGISSETSREGLYRLASKQHADKAANK